MKLKLLLFLFFAAMLFSTYSCSKAGTGGNATVVCTITDANNQPANGVVVYVKYGQSTAPSPNTLGYDDHKQATATSNSVSFTGLKPGTYYFYAVLTNTTNSNLSMAGGGPYSLTHANRNKTNTAYFTLSY